MPTLLIIDDEKNVRFSLTTALASDRLQVLAAETARAGIQQVAQHAPDAVLLDVRLPDMSGLDALREIRAVDARLPVVIITAHGTTDTAIEATKRGAFDYLLKPFDLKHLSAVVERALEASRLARVPALIDHEQATDGDADLIVGRTPAMQEVYKAIGRVAPSDATVLLLGESGTGKELVARAIYQHSPRHGAPLLAINCAAIPEALLESELFGHERGAFTGADRRRIGKFEQADGGTIFLDEIGDMRPATQAKVLRLIQEQRFERLGGSETIQTNVRVIAATNQSLEELVAAGSFRGDLYYRLNVYSIHLPPLRERMDDLPLLVEHFLRHGSRYLGRRVQRIAEPTWKLLRNHPWPGNVRELQAAIKMAIINTTGETLLPGSLPITIREGAVQTPDMAATSTDELNLAQFVRQLLQRGEHDIYRKAEITFDRIVLEQALLICGDNQVEAARRLGISRTTLRTKLQAIRDRSTDNSG